MACYVRHLTDLLEEAGMKNNKENRKKLDNAVRSVLGMHGENCPIVWGQVKDRHDDPEFHRLVLGQLQQVP